jgi:hypothetical protein
MFPPREIARRTVIDLVKRTVAHLKATSSGEDYDVIRADLVNRIEEAFMDFVSQSGAVTRFRSAAGRALAEDIPAAFERGYQDAGGEELDDDDNAWVTAKQSEQIAYMADAFESLKETRANETATEDGIAARAEIWGAMLDGVYSEGKLRGGKNMMLYFDGDDGAESCETCQKLKDGPPRSAKWVREHEMVPTPGNENFECKCFRCQHNWFSVKTDEQVTF